MRDDTSTRSNTVEREGGLNDDEPALEDIPLSAVPSTEAGPSTVAETVTTQAGPLPSKRGEIGYQEQQHRESSNAAQTDSETAMPARHPADRDAPPEFSSISQPTTDTPPTTDASADTSSMHTNSSTKRLLAKFKPKVVPLIKGVRVSSLMLLIVQVLLFVGTIAGWALLTNHLSSLSASSSQTSPQQTSPQQTSGDADDPSSGISTTQIFVHVAFGVGALAQLVFIERRIFRVRAERWAHTHGPGLPFQASNDRRSSTMGIGFAPWNRPPLPTYAAALAQSGVGTGDVEDSRIAIAPPPAYGNTRGSRLLLSGMLTDTMRAQRSRARAEAINRANAEGGSVRGSWASGESSRPVSYASRDEAWEERQDAVRNMRLEETLTRLEDARVRN